MESVEIDGLGGADSVTASVAGLTAHGVTSVVAKLSRMPGAQSTTVGAPAGDTELAVRDDGAADLVTLIGTNADEEVVVTPSGHLTSGGGNVQVEVGGFTLTLVSPSGTTDRITVAGAGGNDNFVVHDGDGYYVSKLVDLVRSLTLLGGEGDDSAELPIIDVTFDGGSGSNTATFDVPHAATVMVDDNRVTRGGSLARYSNLAEVVLDAGDVFATSITVKATHSQLTTLLLGGGITNIDGASGPVDVTLTTTSLTGPGTVNVNAIDAPLNVHLAGTGSNLNVYGNDAPVDVTVDGKAAVSLHATGAPVTVDADSLQDSQVTIGTGLLSRIGDTVAVNNVKTVIYDNRLDGANNSFTLADARAAIVGGWDRSTLGGVQVIRLLAGLGDDSVSATMGRSELTIDGGNGTDQVDVTLTGSPAGLDPHDPGNWLVAAFATEHVTFHNLDNAAATPWTLSNVGLESGSKKLLRILGTALTMNLGNSDDTLNVIDMTGPTNVQLGGGTNTVTVSGLSQTLTLNATSNDNVLTLDDTNSPENPAVMRSLNISRNLITSWGQAISYEQDRFDQLTVNLGAANDAVTARDLPAHTSISAGNGDDHVIVTGALGDLTVHGGAGKDELTMRVGSGQIAFDAGSGLDTLEADRSDAVTNLSGSLTVATGQPVLTLAGLPTLTTIGTAA